MKRVSEIFVYYGKISVAILSVNALLIGLIFNNYKVLSVVLSPSIKGLSLLAVSVICGGLAYVIQIGVMFFNRFDGDMVSTEEAAALRRKRSLEIRLRAIMGDKEKGQPLFFFCPKKDGKFIGCMSCCQKKINWIFIPYSLLLSLQIGSFIVYCTSIFRALFKFL